MSSKTQLKRTYGSRLKPTGTIEPSSPPLSGTKRPLTEVLSSNLSNIPTPLKRTKISPSSTSTLTKCKPKLESKSKSTTKEKTKALVQLHFAIDQTTLRTCPLCELSYTKGAPDDESLHRSHCARVQKGMEWGREEERESSKVGVIEIAHGMKLPGGKRGRIISCPAECSGKIGSKITALLQTINLSLSSPPLTQECLRNSKVYMFLLAPTTVTMTSSGSGSSSGREKIVGCVVAQHITTAMAIVSADANINRLEREGGKADDKENPKKEESDGHLVVVDSGSGLFCDPERLPTPMGIPRLFVPSTYRRKGIASALLDAAAATFIHGCRLDPKKGQVGFTQPTESGKGVMMKWGEGSVRIYEE